MSLPLPETLKAAEDLKNEFKCLKCFHIPDEPYFTGVCDHLLCKECLEKSNECPLCNASFYKSEAHLSKMVREAIIYVNNIINLTNGTYESPEKNELPILDLSFEKKEVKPLAKSPVRNLLPPMPPPSVTITKDTKPNLKTSKAKVTKSMTTQPKTRTKTTGHKLPIKQDELNVSTNLSQSSQSSMSSQFPKRSQSVKKPKKNNKGELPIHLAVMKEDVAELQQLLNDETVDVNAKDNAGWTPLHEACNKGHLELVELLLKHNADINALGYQNNTPLHEAALNKKLECVTFLIANGVNQNVRNLFGILPKDFVKNNKEFDGVFDAKIEISNDMTQRVNEIKEVQLMNMASQIEVPSTYVKKMRPKVVKKKLLFGTGMNDEGKQELNKVAAMLNIQVAKSMNSNVTHVLFNTGKVCSRTMNYMKAILMGIWIVSIEWLIDSVENDSVKEENKYEAEGSQKIVNSNGPFKGDDLSRMNASCQYPKLFEDCFFYLHGKFNVFDKSDMTKLVELAGGQILKREPKVANVKDLLPEEMPHHLDLETNKDFSCAYYILYDLDQPLEINHKYLKTVRPKWLFECIDEFKILEPNFENGH